MHNAFAFVVITSDLLIFRYCITHCTPRNISMPLTAAAKQIICVTMLEHELCSLIFRRLRQIDMKILYPNMEDVYRHFFEADFSV